MPTKTSHPARFPNQAQNTSLPHDGSDILRDFESLSRTALLDDRQIAALVHVKPATVKGWRARGIGPEFTHLHGRARASVAAVRAWLAALPGTPQEKKKPPAFTSGTT